MAKRILLVDDEPLIIKGLKYTLEQEGYETLSAMDGEEALSVFFSNTVDLVLLDVMLPKLDGIQVCQRIRENSNVPIIMLTAKGEDNTYYVVYATSTQPLLCADGTFVTVGNLKIMKKLAGGLTVQEVEYDEFCKVYDLKVSGENNYYADGFVAKGGTNEW